MSTNYRDLAPEVPFLPGQRVCLNPEGPNYTRYHSQSRGEAGYVTNVDGIDGIVHQWKRISPSTRATYYVRVK